MKLDILSQQLINAYQVGFPLCSRPFLQLAKGFNVSEQKIITCFEQLTLSGILSRLGPVFDHKRAGVSTLAAIKVPPHKLNHVAQLVNQFEEVNHNYAREHEFNLWFVACAPTKIELDQTINNIEQVTGYTILVLPMTKSYHIDLSFKVCFK